MTFDKLYSLIQEGIFSLPQYVYKNILDYYNATAKIAKQKQVQRITEKSFPVKNFPINLKGTRYDFLIDKLMPFTKGKGFTVNISFTMKHDEAFYHNWHVHTGKNTFAEDLTGNIQLCLSSIRSTNYHILEHEVLHYIQELLKKYKTVSHYKDQDIGGLPPYKYLPKDVDTHGYKQNGKRRGFKRVNHSNRPTEYYTDLLSAVRELQMVYSAKSASENISKKDFFQIFLNDIKRKKVIYNSAPLATDIFRTIRSSNYPLYKVLLKKAYDAFVNGYNNFDAEEITRLVVDAKAIDAEQREKNLKEKNELPEEQRIFDVLPPKKVEYHDVPEYSNLEDENYIFGEETFYALPYTKFVRATRSDDYFSISMKWNHLIAIFKKIQSLYDKEQDPKLKENYIYFAKELMKTVMEHADRHTRSIGFNQEKQNELAKKLFEAARS